MRFWRRRREELEEELQTHLQMAAQDRAEQGKNSAEAKREVRREFGNVGLIREVTAEMWGWGSLERLVQDVRFGWRVLLKSPGFTAVAVLTLALGIGANSALFSVVNGVLLKPLPYPHPEQLVWLAESKPNFASGSISWPNFQDWQKQNSTFSEMGVYRAYSFNLTGQGDAEQVNGRYLSADFFNAVGVKPELGRGFLKGEDAIGAAPIAIITDGLWQRKFSGSPEVIGEAVNLDGQAYRVVGVLPAGFDLSGMFRGVDVYVPIGQWGNPLLPKRGAGLGIHGIGRLKTGVTIEQARADLARVSSNLAAAYPESDTGIGAFLKSLKQAMVGEVSTLLLVLLAAVGFVLLIACVNVANLMLARAAARQKEFAIRAAMGAGRTRLVRQLLTESLLLAWTGGLLGLALAGWGTQAALHTLAEGLPRASEVHLDTRALVLTLAISVVCGIFFGLTPALKARAGNVHDTLKEGGRGGSGARHRAQGVFVAAEMALALVLLISAGLMLRSLTALWNVNPGFNSKNVMTFGVALPPAMRTATADGIRAALRNVDERLKAVPGVAAASLSWGALPLASDDEDLFWIEGKPKPEKDDDMLWSLSYVVEPDYLRVMGIPLQRGRFIAEQDNENAPHVVVVDDVFAKKYFPGEDPVGQHIFLQNKGGSAEIIGVVGHVKQWGLSSDDTETLRAELYFPYMQLPDQAMQLSWNGTGVVVRYEPGVAGIAEALRAAVKGISAEHVMSRTQSMDSIISDSLASQRFSMAVLGIFGALALGLASVGIYGVISYLVGLRTQEIGIRVALGANRSDVLRMVLGDGMKMTLVGVAIGLVAALGLTQLMASLLYGVSARDPLTFISVAALLALVALAACYLPARRAMRVDPIVALRHE